MSCACANDFICMRDSDKYAPLFLTLDISDKIEYKTLSKICKSYIESSDGTSNKSDITIG